MRFHRRSLRDVFAVIVSAVSFAGCANTCFMGFVNDGKAAASVQTGDAVPSCSLAQARGAIHVVALKSTACASCTVDARVKHVFVTLKSIQLRAKASDGAPKDWLEIAPELAIQPRQVDLVGNSPPEIWHRMRLPQRAPMMKCTWDFALTPAANVKPQLPVVQPCGIA